jgi:hypothetical protein
MISTHCMKNITAEKTKEQLLYLLLKGVVLKILGQLHSGYTRDDTKLSSIVSNHVEIKILGIQLLLIILTHSREPHR